MTKRQLNAFIKLANRNQSISEFRHVDNSILAIRKFEETHSTWWGQFNIEEPKYALSKDVVGILTKPYNKCDGLLNREMAESEIAFSDLCKSNRSIGIFGRSHIKQSIFLHREPIQQRAITKNSFEWEKNFSENDYQLANIESEKTRDRIIACLYPLWTSQIFLDEANTLKKIWLSITEDNRPSFPFSLSDLSQPGNSEEHNKQTEAKPVRKSISEINDYKKTKTFKAAMRHFLNRWCLNQLLTWDLPNPQGIIKGSSAGFNSLTLPSSMITLQIPINYSVKGNDDLLNIIEQYQIENVKNFNLPSSFQPSGSTSANCHKAKLIFLEKSIRQRFPNQLPPYYTYYLEIAAKEMLHISVSRIHRYFTEIKKAIKKSQLDVNIKQEEK